MAEESTRAIALDRRSLLIGGGAGLGLVVAWAVWPRTYRSNLTAAPGETVYGAWLKIGADGAVTVAVPQAEHGQGVYTTLPQILADELGADWRTVAVEPAPLNPLYGNRLGAETLFEGVFDRLPEAIRDRHVQSAALVLTAGSTSVRSFEDDLRKAGAAARVLLCKAAARRWGTDWRACGTAQGFVVRGGDRLRFAELAEAAHKESVPDMLPLRTGEAGRLSGQSLPRLDTPAKVDGSANFAGDIRLADLLYCAIRRGPVGDSTVLRFDRAAADRVRGVRAVVSTERWVAVAATDWWAAKRALDAMHVTFTTMAPADSRGIDEALEAAFAGTGQRMVAEGNLGPVFKGARVVTAAYRVGLAPHAALEPPTATAQWKDGRLELWLATQAPGLARSAAARAIGVSENAVTVHPMLIGGSFGAALESEVAAQAARLAVDVKKPIQLIWSREEDLTHDAFRAPAQARMAARLDANGQVLGWLAKIAAPRTGHELAERLMTGDATLTAARALPGAGDGYAVAGARPIYRIPNLAIDHHPAEIGVPTGHWRSGAHSYTCFFTECFVDELAHVAGTDALSFRIQMLHDVRMAHCLSTAASIGGWDGGAAGTGQGIACHAFRGSYIAVLAEAHVDPDQSVSVDRLVAVVDCGRQINPDVVRQQIEGGLVFGMAAALGASSRFVGGMPSARRLRDLKLPRLADTPDVTVELIRSEADPSGVSELAVPPVAPAIANALMAATGARIRTLPLVVGGL